MLKHAFASAKTDGADATQVQPSNWNADHVIDMDGATMTVATSTPAAPAAGSMVLFARSIGGSSLPASVGASGMVNTMQPFFGQKRVVLWQPLGNTTSFTGGLVGVQAPVTSGTLTSRGFSTASLLASLQRVGIVSAATAGARALACFNSGTYFWRGNGANMGGFRSAFRFCASDSAAVSTANMFVGFAPSSTVGSSSAEPSASVNIIGVGNDSTDANLQLYANDGTGVASKIDLGVNFPANTLSADIYELMLHAPPNSSSIGYTVTRLNTGHITSGTISTNLPDSAQVIFPIYMRGNMGTALAVSIDILNMYIEAEL